MSVARLYVAKRRPKPMVRAFGIQHFFGGFNFRLRGAAAQALLAYPVPNPGNQALASVFVRAP